MTAADASTETDPAEPATVVGMDTDALVGSRVRKSFGSRAFWGTVVSCYWVSGGLFYKVGFDDGDVDIFSADETMRDAKLAGKHSKEDPKHKEKEDASAEETVRYFKEMRRHSLKRKRDDPVDTGLTNVRRVTVWGQRLYATIYTNEQNETYIKELMKTEDGQEGELAATGQVQPGDLILAVHNTRVLGLPSRQVSDLIRKPKRPISLVFYRPPGRRQNIVEQEGTTSDQTSTAQISQAEARLMQPPPNPTRLTPHAAGDPVLGQQQLRPQDPPAAASAPVPPSSSPTQPTIVRAPGSVSSQSHQGYVHKAPQQTSRPLPAPQQIQSARQILNQMIAQEAALRQWGGYMRGGGMIPPNLGPTVAYNPPASSGANHVYPPGHNSYAAMRNFAVPTVQPIMSSMIRPQMATQQVPVTTRGVQWRRTGVHTTERIQVREQTSAPLAPPVQSTEIVPSFHPNAPHLNAQPSSTSGSPENRFSTSQGEPELRDESPEPVRIKSEPFHHSSEPMDNSPLNSMIRPSKPTRTTSSSAPPTPGKQTTRVNADAAVIAALAVGNPAASTNSTATETSHAMSFLSPHSFSELSVPSKQNHSIARTAQSATSTNSSASCVVLKISRPRLYLTLGAQGSFIAVTSFVPDEVGGRGEVEASGKVFVGDVLVAINGTRLKHNSTPYEIALMVNAAPRPMTLSFERASWDALEGKE